MGHQPLFVGFFVAVALSVALGVIAFRPAPDFPREAPLAASVPPNIDEEPTAPAPAAGDTPAAQ